MSLQVNSAVLLDISQRLKTVIWARDSKNEPSGLNTHNNTIKDQPACKSVFCRVYRVSSKRLKRIQKLLRSGVRAHAFIGQRGQDTLEYLH